MKKLKFKRIHITMKRKLMLTFGAITLAFVALIGVLTRINAVSGSAYAKIVLSQQSYDSTSIPYKRGDITDRNGTIISTSTKVYNLILDTKVLLTDSDDVTPTITSLCECFPELSSTELENYISENPQSQYKKLLEKLSYEEISEFAERMNDNENYPNIGGVWFETEYQREYPYPTLASELIGFTASDGTGMAGMESSYDDELTGVDGREYGYLNSDSNVESTVIAAKDGNTVVSTIDLNIQSIVEEKILAFNEKYAGAYREDEDGSENTAVIVMDPNSGEILAMASYPSYDLSNPRDLTAYYTDEEINVMTDEEELDALNEIWQNYCVTETYEPGSTAKVFTVAGALDAGVVSDSDSFYCDGYQEVGGYTIHCSHIYGHGMLTLSGAIEESCNDALMQIAAKMGKTNFCHFQNVFNFGLRTTIDLPGEALTSSLIHTEEDMISTDLATNSFGQNFNCTMIQLVSAFSSVINGGDYYWPHVAKKIVDSDGNTVSTIDPVILKKTVSAETSELLKEYLYQTVERGTGTDCQIEGYKIGGKTGTGEKLPRDKENYLVSFVGFAPVDDPQVVVYVVVDEPNSDDQAHAGFAEEIAHDIFEEILPYMNIFPESTGQEE